MDADAADMSTSSGDDDDDGDEGDDDAMDEAAPQGVPLQTPPAGPVVDEDGFTLVQKGRARRGGR